MEVASRPQKDLWGQVQVATLPKTMARKGEERVNGEAVSMIGE
jgi:hypothetical protein